MRRLLVLGGGTAGTMVANRLRRWLKPRDWRVAIVDDDERHFYQPGFLFIPFGVCDPADVVKTKRDLIHDGVEFVVGAVDRVEPDENEVRLTDGRRLPYDYLVISYDERAIPFDLLRRRRSAGSRPSAESPRRTSSPCSRRNRPRRWPTSPDCPSQSAACERRRR